MVLQNRPSQSKDHTGQQNQQQAANKRPKKSPADDLKFVPSVWSCHGNPSWPRMGGRVYERECIEDHIKNNPWDLWSPITRARMGTRLLPAIQHRNTIETLVESGAIEEELADKWNEKKKQKKRMEELLEEAEEGDPDAMYYAGVNYSHGQKGFKKDHKLSFYWYKRAHEAGDVRGTASLGGCYLAGDGVAPCISRGFVHVTTAANKGSDLAACLLGMANVNGWYGMVVDKVEAIQWLEKATDDDCLYIDLKKDAKDEARELLNDLRAQVRRTGA